MDTLEIEVVEEIVFDPNIEVGSGLDWRGRGKEPQWDNPKSKAYDHIARHHGPKLKPHNLKGRASSFKRDQGQWLNERFWVVTEKIMPKNPGLYILKFNSPIGRVYHPDGGVTEHTYYAKIGRNEDGTLSFGYPIIY